MAQVTAVNVDTTYILDHDSLQKKTMTHNDLRLLYNFLDPPPYTSLSTETRRSRPGKTAHPNSASYSYLGTVLGVRQCFTSLTTRLFTLVIRAEIFALADDGDAAILIKHDLKFLLMNDFPLHVLTHSATLFSVVIKCTATTEKALMDKMRSVREALDRRHSTE